MPSWLRKLFPGARAPVPAAIAPAPDAEGLRQQGNAHLEAGRLDAAAASYGAALSVDARSVPALINLAYVRLRTARPAEAEPLLTQALAIEPGNIDGHYMLAGVLRGRGERGQAMAHLESALRLQPGFSPARSDLCRALFEDGQHLRARAVAEEGVKIDPQSAELHCDLGNVMLQSNEISPAIESFQSALKLRPSYPEARVDLGNALLIAGRQDEALASLRLALGERPASAAACRQLGTLLQHLGQLDAAVAAYRMAVELDARDPLTNRNLAVALQLQGKLEAAAASFRQVASLQLESASALCDLGQALQALRRTDEAAECYMRALVIAPDHAAAYAHGAVLLVEQGDTEGALAQFEQALEFDPGFIEARSSQLFVLSSAAVPQAYWAAAREYGRQVSALARPFDDWLIDLRGNPTADAPLKVGLVSGDLRAHPVGFFIESVLANLASHHVQLHAFPTSPHEDEVSARLKKVFADWTPLASMTNEIAAGRIRELGIHVLIDLSGHTAHNRLPLFAWRPAPVQVSWLGYFASTGVPAIDYVLADPNCVPEGEQDQFCEKVWRLPSTRLCFTEPAARAAVPVNELPAIRNGYVTFGCFQNLGKLNEEVLAAWRQILAALPDARLRLQSEQLQQPACRERALGRLRAAGIDTQRVTLAAPAQRLSYLAAYGEVDIVLDTFPFPGGTTTCESLWMGVPTVTRVGHSMLSRQGEALVRCAGLQDWIAEDASRYVDLALAHARDVPALATLRRSLRERVLASPLFDGPRFAADLAAALTGMWLARQA
jgi:predicted O-linked N-acetylglucosamine transferase (SPINDLY family)